MSRAGAFLLAALPAVLGLELPDGVGRLPALGWNSWVGLYVSINSPASLISEPERILLRRQPDQDHAGCECHG